MPSVIKLLAPRRSRRQRRSSSRMFVRARARTVPCQGLSRSRRDRDGASRQRARESEGGRAINRPESKDVGESAGFAATRCILQSLGLIRLRDIGRTLAFEQVVGE